MLKRTQVRLSCATTCWLDAPGECPAPRHRLPPRNPRPQRQPIPQSGKRCADRLHGSETPDRMRTKYHIIPAKPAAQCGWRLNDPAFNPATPDGGRKHRPRRNTCRPSRRRLELLRFQPRKTIPGAATQHPGRTAIPIPAKHPPHTCPRRSHRRGEPKPRRKPRHPPRTAISLPPLPLPKNRTGRGNKSPWPDGHSDSSEHPSRPCPRRSHRPGEPKPCRKTGLRLRTAFQWPPFHFRNAIPGAETPAPPENRPPSADSVSMAPVSIPQRLLGCGQISYRCRETGNPL